LRSFFDPDANEFVCVGDERIGIASTTWELASLYLADSWIASAWQRTGIGRRCPGVEWNEAWEKNPPVEPPVLRANLARPLCERLNLQLGGETATHLRDGCSPVAGR
jgi:hypothetical protein